MLDHLKPRKSDGKAAVAQVDRTGLPIDRLVRVSRVGDRSVSSESYQTERQQIDSIDHMLAAKQLTAGELFVSRDESGHAWEEQRDQLAEALRRVREGESGGIIVAYFSRFARTAPEAIAAIRELNNEGAVFISAQEGLDSTTEMGRFSLGLLALLADMEWNRLAQGWQTSVEMAIRDGRYVAGAVPVGYLMGEDKRLVPDEREVGPDGERCCDLIGGLFRMRVEEQLSWTRLADWLTEMGVRPNTAEMIERTNPDRPSRAEHYGPDGWQRWGTSSIQGIIKNPAYLGYARSIRETGEMFINETAHPPLVSEELWLAAQQAKGGNGGRTGEMSDRCLLKSKAVCETCGHKLLITGRFDKGRKERLPLYYCRGRYAGGDCSARANIDAAKLDNYVEQLFLDHIAGLTRARRASREDQKLLVKLERALDEADTALQYWIDNTGELLAKIGADRYGAALEEKQAILEERRLELVQAQGRRQVTSGLNDGNLLKSWPELSRLEKRAILVPVIEKVIIKPAHGKKGRGAPPVEERVEVVWARAFS